jgi:predicted O-methyltransferase YrrM
MTFNDIGLAENTDKAALTDRGSHHYGDLYELLFRGRRNDPISILEIGVLDGASIRTWRRYFPYSEVTAIDVSDNVRFDDPMVEFIHGDAYSEEVISKLDGSSFDLMIDDGDHRVENQTIFLQRYSPLLKPEGILIIEDVITRDGAKILKSNLPSGFSCATVEMAEGNSIIDSRLFIAYRQ